MCVRVYIYESAGVWHCVTVTTLSFDVTSHVRCRSAHHRCRCRRRRRSFKYTRSQFTVYPYIPVPEKSKVHTRHIYTYICILQVRATCTNREINATLPSLHIFTSHYSIITPDIKTSPINTSRRCRNSPFYIPHQYFHCFQSSSLSPSLSFFFLALGEL